MIKGGFQGLDISGVDLTAQSPTLPGAYAACAAADGKTVLVLTAAGAVQCSVKKVSTNYVLAGITGDAKILSIAVGTTDGIEVIETEIPSGGGGEEADVYLDGAVDISSATSSQPYTTEYDGIVLLISNSGTVTSGLSVVKALLGAAHSENTIILALPSGSFKDSLVSCFMKKGSMLYALLAANTSAKFLPYKPVQS